MLGQIRHVKKEFSQTGISIANLAGKEMRVSQIGSNKSLGHNILN